MNAEVFIRNLVPEDATAVWQLGHQVFDWPSEQFLFDESAVHWFVDHAAEASFVAIYHDRIIGFILCRTREKFGFVSWITADASWRGQGIGGQLMQRALSVLRAAGIEQVTAFVREDHSADRLFERCGFHNPELRKLDLVIKLTGTPQQVSNFGADHLGTVPQEFGDASRKHSNHR